MPQKYRESRPEEMHCDDEQEEFDLMHQLVQHLNQTNGPNDLLDNLLVIANLCEMRSILHTHEPRIKQWYDEFGMNLRLLLLAMTGDVAKPNKKLENQALYHPEAKVFH